MNSIICLLCSIIVIIYLDHSFGDQLETTTNISDFFREDLDIKHK